MTMSNDSDQRLDDSGKSILNWNGKYESFHKQVMTQVERVIKLAVDENRATPLYRMGSALLVEKENLLPGHVHLIFNLLERQKKNLFYLEYWEDHVERVLIGTLAAIIGDKIPIEGIYHPEEQLWYKAVFTAMHKATGEHSEHFEAFDALVELTARVFTTRGIPSAWWDCFEKSATALASRAKCQEPIFAAPFSIQALLEENNTNFENEHHYHASVIILCLRVSALKTNSNGKDPVEQLARRIIMDLHGSERDNKQKGDSTDIIDLVRHLAFEKKSPVSKLLERCIDYQPYPYQPKNYVVDSVDSLDLNIILIGEKMVGKSSFLFASEGLSIAEAGENPDPRLGAYPRVNLKRIADGDLEVDRNKWEKLEPSDDITYKLYAETEPFDLCAFNIIDPPGEIVGPSSVKEESEYFGYLPEQIERMSPSVLAIMLGTDEDNECREDTYFKKGLERAIQNIKKISSLEQPNQVNSNQNVVLNRSTISYPVYIIQNQADKMIGSFRRNQSQGFSRKVEEKEEGYRTNLAKKIGSNSFDIGQYFYAASSEDAIHQLLCDDRLAPDDPAVRNLVRKVWEKQWWLFDLLRSAGFRNVNLVFASSILKDKVKTPSVHVGIEAFWRHLWIESSKVFSSALKDAAQSLLVHNLENAAKSIAHRCKPNQGITLPSAPQIDVSEISEAFCSLYKEDIVISSIRKKFEPHENLQDQMPKLFNSYQQILDKLDSFEDDVKLFMSLWSDALRQLIIELNVSPDTMCGAFHPERLDDAVIEQLRNARSQLTQNSDDDSGIGNKNVFKKGLMESDVHGCLGALRHSSLIGEIYEMGDERETDEATSKALKWLDKEPRIRIFDRVRSDLGLDKIIEYVLRLISDWGMDSRLIDEQNMPDYNVLAVRRYERNRFLLRAHLDANNAELNKESPADRIEKVIELVVKLGEIRANLLNMNLINEMGITEESRSAVEMFALHSIVRALTFDVNKFANSNDLNDLLASAEKELCDAIESGFTFFNRGRKANLNLIQSIERKLDPFKIAGSGSVLLTGGSATSSATKCREAYKVVAFLKRVKMVMGTVGDFVPMDEGTRGLSATLERYERALSELDGEINLYNCEVLKYSEMSLRIFLYVQYRFVEQIGLLKDEDKKIHLQNLAGIISEKPGPIPPKPNGSKDGGSVHDESHFRERFNKRVSDTKSFADKVECLIGRCIADLN